MKLLIYFVLTTLFIITNKGLALQKQSNSNLKYIVEIVHGDSSNQILFESNNLNTVFEISPNKLQKKIMTIDNKKSITLSKKLKEIYSLTPHESQYCKRKYLKISYNQSENKIFCIDSKTTQAKKVKDFLKYIEIYYRTQK